MGATVCYSFHATHRNRQEEPGSGTCSGQNFLQGSRGASSEAPE